MAWLRFTAGSSVLCAARLAGSGATAAPLSAAQAGLILQGAIGSYSLYMLTDFSLFQPGESLSYQAAVDNAKWSASYSGLYRGLALTVAETGDLTAYPAGAIGWTGSGSYGADAWASSGSATFSGDLSGFDIAYQSLLSVGVHSGSYALTLHGSSNGARITVDFVTGLELVDGVPLPTPHLALSLPGEDDAFVGLVISNLDYVRGGAVLNPGVVTPGPTADSYRIDEQLVTRLVAEPPGIAIALLALLLLSASLRASATRARVPRAAAAIRSGGSADRRSRTAGCAES